MTINKIFIVFATVFAFLCLSPAAPVMMTARAELIVNGGFEQWTNPLGPPDGWSYDSGSGFSVQQESTIVHSGLSSGRANKTSTSDRSLEQTDLFPVTPGMDYRFSVWVLDSTAECRTRCWISWYDSGPDHISNSYTAYSDDTPAWQMLAVTATAPANAVWATVRIRIYDFNNMACDVYLDDASMDLASAATPTPAESITPPPSTLTPTPVEPPPCGEELSCNGEFELWTVPAGPPDCWQVDSASEFSVEREDAQIHGGLHSAKVMKTSYDDRTIFQAVDFPIVAGDSYQLTFWAFDNDPEGRLRAWIRWEDAGHSYITNSYTDYSQDFGDWQLLERIAPAPATAVYAQLIIKIYDLMNLPATFYIDDVSFIRVCPWSPTATPTPTVTNTPTWTPTPGPNTPTATPVPSASSTPGTPTPPPCDEDQLCNGGMELWTNPDGPPDCWSLDSSSGFTVRPDEMFVHGGTTSAVAVNTSTGDRSLEQSVIYPITPGCLYELSAWVLDNDPGGRVRAWIRWEREDHGYISNSYTSYTADSVDWQRLVNEVEAPSSAAWAKIIIRMYDACTVYLDDISFIAPCGTPTPVPTVTVTPTGSSSPTPTPTGSRTPAGTPTPTASPTPIRTPTPECANFGVRLEIPTESVHPGDLFYCTASICAPHGSPNPVPLFALLDIGIGEYWFWPSWSHYPPFLDYGALSLRQGYTEQALIAPFSWPDTGSSSFYPVMIHAAVLDQSLTEIVGELDTVMFGYGPR